MIDLVKALRYRATWETATGVTEPRPHIDWMAADEIERLREENARLRGEVADLRATLRNCLTDSNFMRAAAAAIREGGKDE